MCPGPVESAGPLTRKLTGARTALARKARRGGARAGRGPTSPSTAVSPAELLPPSAPARSPTCGCSEEDCPFSVLFMFDVSVGLERKVRRGRPKPPFGVRKLSLRDSRRRFAITGPLRRDAGHSSLSSQPARFEHAVSHRRAFRRRRREIQLGDCLDPRTTEGTGRASGQCLRFLKGIDENRRVEGRGSGSGSRSGSRSRSEARSGRNLGRSAQGGSGQDSCEAGWEKVSGGWHDPACRGA